MRGANVVKFPKPNKLGGSLPIWLATLTPEQIIEAREVFKKVGAAMLADYEAAIEARRHPSVVHLRPRPAPNDPDPAA
jgi:predicted DNA-binding transcriptional regulator AlpA